LASTERAAGGSFSTNLIYTDFADLIGEEREIDLPGFAADAFAPKQ
jgi:hypothetical protein